MDQRLDEMKLELLKVFDVPINSLLTIWDELGLVGDNRQARFEVVTKYVDDLLNSMVEEETELRAKLIANVETHGKELLKLCKDLSLPPSEPGEGLSILQLNKELKAQIDQLKEEKNKRVTKLKMLKETDQHLCDIMCTTPYYIPSGTVPSEEQLEELQQHVKTLSEEKERLTRQFISAKSSIAKLMDELEQSPNSSFERDILCDEEDSFLLSRENMTALQRLKNDLELKLNENFAEANSLRERMQTLWERLQVPGSERETFNAKCTGFKPKTIQALKDEIKRCEGLMVVHIKQVIEATRKELVDLWDKCYFSQQQREAFKPYFSDDFSQELLEIHDSEVRTMKQHYENYQNLFEKVATRQKLWAEFLSFERKTADPNRFYARGWNSLKEEKIRKKLMKDLPRVEQQVAEQIEEWEKQMEQEFLVEGVRFLDYIKSQWDNYNVQKENEKLQRNQAKKETTEEEMMRGSTPAKRPHVHSGTTPARTPKQRKLNETPGRTPRSASRLMKSVNHTSMFMSPYSGPKSASKSRTPHHGTRKALGDRNGTNDTIFSQTTISGFGGSVQSLHTQPDTSLASVGGYNEFAVGLNSTQKVNCRSSVVPRARPAYF